MKTSVSHSNGSFQLENKRKKLNHVTEGKRLSEVSFTYNIHQELKSNEERTCLLPYEATESGIDMNFNYFIKNKSIFSSEIQKIIVNTLNCIDIMQFRCSPVKTLIVVTVKGVNIVELTRSIQNLPFLSSCSSIPIYHAAIESKVYIEKNIWRPMDLEEITSNLFYTSKPTLSIDQLAELSVANLFKNHIVVFDCVTCRWKDKINFHNFPTSKLKLNYDSLLQQKRVFIESLSNKESSEILLHHIKDIEVLRDDDLIGKMKRHQVADSGIYLFRKVPHASKLVHYELYLLWYKGGNFECMCTEALPESPDTPISLQFKLKHSSNIDMKEASMGIVEVMVVGSADLEEEVESTAVEGDSFHDIQRLFSKLSSARDLELLLLSPRLMDLMGYPMDSLEGKYVSTSIRAEAPAAPNEVDVEMEEGEESESVPTPMIHAEAEADARLFPDRSHLVNTLASLSAPLEVCALDCEMSYTAAGLELVRATLLAPQGVVLDTLVKPSNPIINYNTTFSGIEEADLASVTVELADVQALLLRAIDEKTILVGHSLDCDLKALRLHHDRVVDTAALFPHPKGLPYKQSLKQLAWDHLRKRIQDDSEQGHDSTQDAMIALELALLQATSSSIKIASSDTTIPRVTLFQTAQLPRPVSVSVYGSSQRLAASAWERFLLGYNAASSAIHTIHTIHAMSGIEVDKAWEFPRSHEAALALMENLRSLPPEPSPHPPRLFVLEMNAFECDSAPGASMEDVDGLLGAVFAAAPGDSLLLAVTQADLSRVRELQAKKLRCKWEGAPERQRIAGAKPSTWSEEQERQLIVSSALGIHGCMFLKTNHQDN